MDCSCILLGVILAYVAGSYPIGAVILYYAAKKYGTFKAVDYFSAALVWSVSPLWAAPTLTGKLIAHGL